MFDIMLQKLLKITMSMSQIHGLLEFYYFSYLKERFPLKKRIPT